MKLLHLLFLLLLLFTGQRSLSKEVPFYSEVYDSFKWPKVTLKLSKQGKLVNIFDSGLRPFRFPGLENFVLEVKHFNLRTILASGKRLPEFPVELMSMHPFYDGELSTLEARTPTLTVEDARMHMKRWLSYGQLANGSPSEQDLENYLNAAQNDLMDFDHIGRGFDHGCAVGWREPGWKVRGGGPSCVVYFRKTSNINKPLFLNIAFTWSSNRPPIDRKYYREPIPPPPGYEHISMKAPKNFGPDSAANILKSQGYDIGDGGGGKPLLGSGVEAQKEPRKPSRKPKEKLEMQEPEAEATPSKWPIILAVLLVIGGLLAWFRARSKKF